MSLRPSFRITPNTSVSFALTAYSSQHLDVQAAGIVLSVVKQGAALVSPAGALATSLNKDSIKQTSTLIDSSISQLVSSSYEETIVESRLLSEWSPHFAIDAVFYVPPEFYRPSRGQKPSSPLAVRYRITMGCPRLSVFDTVNGCEDRAKSIIYSKYHNGAVAGNPSPANPQYQALLNDLATRVSAHQVLDFKLGNGTSLRQYLLQQEWFLSYAKQIAQYDSGVSGTSSAPTQARNYNYRADITAQFCEAVVDKLFTAGLSKLDAGIGLWAIATGLPDFASLGGAFKSSSTCNAHLPRALDQEQGRPLQTNWAFTGEGDVSGTDSGSTGNDANHPR